VRKVATSPNSIAATPRSSARSLRNVREAAEFSCVMRELHCLSPQRTSSPLRQPEPELLDLTRCSASNDRMEMRLNLEKDAEGHDVSVSESMSAGVSPLRDIHGALTESILEVRHPG